MNDTTPTSAIVPAAESVRFLPSPHEAERIWKLATSIAGTEFVPRDIRGKPEAILAAMMTGREIGIGPMHALRAIDVIDGRPALSPELMASLVLRHPAGHTLWPQVATSTRCVMVGRRGDWPDTIPDAEVEWTLQDARLAGLVGASCQPEEGVHDEREVTRNGRNGTYTKVECGCRQGWKTYPRAMLRARATSELCRAVFPDVVERVSYVVEELGGAPPAHADAMDVVRDVAPDQADRVDGDFDDAEVVDAELVDDGDAPDRAVSGADPSGSDDTGQVDDAAEAAASDDGWRAAAADAGVTGTQVLRHLVRTWPDGVEGRPSKVADIDDVCSSKDGRARVADAIASVAWGEEDAS